MLLTATLVLLLVISYHPSSVNSRSFFRGISSDETDDAASSESKMGNNTFKSHYLRNYPYTAATAAKNSHSNYNLIGLGPNGRLFRIPAAESTAAPTVTKHKSTPAPTPRPPKCGMVPHFNDDFGNSYNDSYVSNGQIPWQAAVFTADGQFLCSAVLVSPKHVLTAAICLLSVEYVKSPHLLEVRVGAWDLRGMVSSSEEPNYYFATTTANIFLYPEMNISQAAAASLTTTTSKIALFELKEAIDLAMHANIRPICLERIPTPYISPRNKALALNSSENVIDDKKTNATHGKRGKKDFQLRKKTQSNNKKILHRLSSASKHSIRGRNANGNLECYVAGWGSQSQPSVNFLAKKLQKRDIEERASISSLTVPIISGGKYTVHVDPSRPSLEASHETEWSFKPASVEIPGAEEIVVNATNSEPETSNLTALLEDILMSAKTARPVPPELDPIEDYLDSLETIPTTKSMAQHDSQSKSRKKQLKPYTEFRETYPSTTFHPIESDELLVDKQDADEDERRTLNLNNQNLRLRWTLVATHNISNADRVDLGLGTAYLKPSRSKDPDTLCMVDIGSPIICRKRSSLIHPHPSNMQKILAGIVTWKMPCFGTRANDDIALSMNELETNYDLAQVTPINDVLDFILERVKESETASVAATLAPTTLMAVGSDGS